MEPLAKTFDVIRMSALKDYGLLEWELSALLQTLLGTTAEKAKLIFYRIVNTRARYGIIDDLISIGHPQCKPFWNQLENLLQGTDTKRNHLTHWMDVLDVSEARYYLENPVTLLRNLPGALRYSADDLKDFEHECRQLAQVIRLFRRFLKNETDIEGLPQPLIDIFRRPPENPRRGEFRQALFAAMRLAPAPPLRV